MSGRPYSELHRSSRICSCPPGFQQAFRSFLSGGVENPVHNCLRHLSAAVANPMIARHGFHMAKRRHAENQNLLFFPALEGTAVEGTGRGGAGELMSTLTSASVAILPDVAKGPGDNCEVVISGSYRKDFGSLRLVFEEFRDLGCKILSPSNVSIVSEQDGFVYMRGGRDGDPGKHRRQTSKCNTEGKFCLASYTGGLRWPLCGFRSGICSRSRSSGLCKGASEGQSLAVLCSRCAIARRCSERSITKPRTSCSGAEGFPRVLSSCRAPARIRKGRPQGLPTIDGRGGRRACARATKARKTCASRILSRL